MHRSALREGKKTKPSKECNSHARNNTESLVFTWPACRHTRRSGFSRQSRTDPARFPIEACVWGDLDKDDRKENELSLKQGFRLLSSYHTNAGTKIWVITEADRSV